MFVNKKYLHIGLVYMSLTYSLHIGLYVNSCILYVNLCNGTWVYI